LALLVNIRGITCHLKAINQYVFIAAKITLLNKEGQAHYYFLTALLLTASFVPCLTGVTSENVTILFILQEFMQFIDSIQASFSGQFELSQLVLALLVILTLVIAERYYSRKR